MANKNDPLYPRKAFRFSLNILAATFLAVVSILYIIYTSWSNKLYFEKWKDYDDCGI